MRKNTYPVNSGYVGEIDSMHRRLTDQLRAHHCLDAIRLHRSTHISGLRVYGGAAERVRIELILGTP